VSLSAVPAWTSLAPYDAGFWAIDWALRRALLVEALAVLDRRAADDVTARVGHWRDEYDEERIEAENAQCALPDER